jgi:hypothetical protein
VAAIKSESVAALDRNPQPPMPPIQLALRLRAPRALCRNVPDQVTTATRPLFPLIGDIYRITDNFVVWDVRAVKDIDVTKLRRARARVHHQINLIEPLVAGYHAKLADLETRIQAMAPEPYFKRGELTPIAKEIMREAEETGLPASQPQIIVAQMRRPPWPKRMFWTSCVKTSPGCSKSSNQCVTTSAT